MRRLYRLTLVILVSTTPLTAVTAQSAAEHTDLQGAREQQWLFRELLGSGEPQPTATFLAWDYSAVIFTATCDRGSGEFLLRYHFEQELGPAVFEPLEIRSTAGPLPLRTTRDGRVLEGRARMSEALARIFRAPGELEIVAPNEMGEPWHVGRAEPLRRLALSCS